MRKFFLTGRLVGGCCDRMFSVAKVCMLLPQHRWVGGCDLDLERVASSLQQPCLVLALQILNKGSDISGADDVQQAVFTFVTAME